MKRASKVTLAALIVSAVLAAPGGAMASSLPQVVVASEAAPVSAPVKGESKAPEAPVKDGATEILMEPKLSRSDAVAIARRYFTIPAELGAPNVGLHQSRDAAMWNLEWQSSTKQPEQSRISVGVDAVTGKIVSYSAWNSAQSDSLQLSVTRAEAKVKAEEWLNKLVSESDRKSLRYVESPLTANYWGGATYHFNWQYQVKGYPYQIGVRITIDARSGEMTDYNGFTAPQGADPVLPAKILTEAEAEAAYAQKLPMLLQYQRFMKRGTDESEWRLVYGPTSSGFPRMDQSGTLVGWDGKPLDLESLLKRTPVPASAEPYQKPEKALTQEQALAVAQAITGRKDAPMSSTYGEQGEETKRKSWDFNWTLTGDGGKGEGQQSVSIDAETGLVLTYNSWTEDTQPFGKDEEAPVSLEQAQQKAIAFIQAHRPDLAGNTQMLPADDTKYRGRDEYRPPLYYLRFQELKNGIPLADRAFQISVDARTGEIRNFWYGWEEGTMSEQLPKPTPSITAAQAMNVWMEQQGLEATWTSIWSPEKQTNSAPTLLWVPASTLSIRAIDAVTGAPLDDEGRNLIEAQRSPIDIKSHYAEREIELLWARGVFDLQEGKFNPDQAITADELSRWIILARGMRPFVAYDFMKAAEGMGGAGVRAASQSINSAYFGAALQSGIILPDELASLGDLQGPVSRELFALWAARAMGYSRLAKMEARIEMAFADKAEIGPKYQNSVAILAGLGIVSAGADNKFNPAASLTRADAAMILFAVSAEGRY